MHMADALLSPVVGGTMWVATAGLIYYSSKKSVENHDERSVPLMGVLGAFVLAVQMINFHIPFTGSSGHLSGAMLLAILLGSHSAFLVIASILTLQALLFADGGLLALGCNIFNLGFFPCYIAYPLVYRNLAARSKGREWILAGSVLSSIVGLQLGAFAVVVETTLSNMTDISFPTFTLLMQSIHLAIGLVEGIVTALIVLFMWKARPELMRTIQGQKSLSRCSSS